MALSGLLLMGVVTTIAPAATAGVLCSAVYAGGTPVAGGSFNNGPANAATTAVGSIPAGSTVVNAGVATGLTPTEAITITFPTGTTFNGPLAASHFVVRLFIASAGTCPSSSAPNDSASSWRNPASISGPGASDPPVVTLTMAGSAWLPAGTATGRLVIAASSTGGSRIFHPCAPAGDFTVATVSDSATGSATFSLPGGITPTAAISTFKASGATAPADGITATTFTAQVKDAGAKACVPNASVRLGSTRGALDHIDPPLSLATTDAWGRATFTATSCAPGSPTFTALAKDTVLTPSYVIAYAAASAPCAVVSFLDHPQHTGRGLPFIPAVRARVTDVAGNPLAGVAVRLTIAGSPATARLVNAPGQAAQPGPGVVAEPTAVTGADGVADFTGLTILIEDAAFTNAAYQLRASAGGGQAVSDTFVVGSTSPPWLQQGFSMQRTGWSPNVADFTDPLARFVAGHLDATYSATTSKALGDVTSPILLVDHNEDGVLDVVEVNDQNGVSALAASAVPWVQVWDVSSCAGVCAPTRLQAYATTGNGGRITPFVAAGYAPGTLKPTYFIAAVTNHDGQAFDGVMYGMTGPTGSVVSTAGATPFPTPPLVGPFGPAGALAAVQPMGPGATTRVLAFPFQVSGGVAVGPSAIYSTGEPAGAAVAGAELRPGNAGPEVVSVTARQGLGETGGWDSSIVALCQLGAVVPCSETFTVDDAGLTGLAIGHLDDDTAMDIVASGLRSPTWEALNGPSQGELNVFPGSSNPLGPPSPLAEGRDFDGPPSLAALHDLVQSGPLSIVNVMDGAPPVTDYSGGDAYDDGGDVVVRRYPALAITDEGEWARPGTASQPTESRGGGILLTLDPSPAHGYRPDYVAGARDGTVFAARVTDSSAGNPPAPLWSIGNLGSSTANDVSQGIPLSAMAAGDVTGDCHSELFVGLSGGASQKGEVAILQGKDATSPGAPSWSNPIDYNVIPVSPAWTGAVAPDQDTAPGYGFKAKLAWNRPAADGGLPIVAYKVYRATGLPNDGGPTGPWQMVGFWPSGTPPSFSPYRPFTDLVPAEGDYYYRVAAMTCFTLANDPNADGSFTGDASATFYVEVRFGKTDGLRGIPSGLPAFPAPVQANIAWARLDNYPRPHGCEWVDSYRIYKSTSNTGVVAAGNEVTGSPFNSPIAAGQTAPATYQYTDVNVVRAGWDGNPDTDGNAAGGLYYYAVNPVNCVGESNVFPNPPYAEPSPNQFVVNTRVAKAPVLNSPTIGATGITLTWTPDSIVNGCQGGTTGIGGTIMGFEVYRGTTSGSLALHDTIDASGGFGTPGQPAPWNTPNPSTEPVPGSIPTSYVDADIDSNTDYYYQVTTVNCVGRSLRSLERSFHVPDLPDAPLGLLARPYGDPAYAAAAGKKVQLTWSAVPPAGYGGCTSGITQYTVYRRETPALFAAIATTTTTDHLDATVFVGATYEYAVAAGCSLFESAPSEPVTADVTVPNPPAAPAAAFSSPTTIVVQWTDPGANNGNCNWEEGYRVWRRMNAGAINELAISPILPTGILSWPRSAPPSTSAPPAPATSFTDGTAIFGNTYEYQVAAVNCVGESERSPLALATIGNTVPSFVDAGSPAAGVESGTPTPVTVTAWASSILPGSQAEESSQQLQFTVTYVSDSTSLVSSIAVAPAAMSAGPWSGDLSFTIQPDECGSVTFAITATDDGVMTSGPSPLPAATSVSHSITIEVACINEPPTFDDLGDPTTISIPSSDVPVTLANWANNISPGPGATEAGQKLLFDIEFGTGTTAIFAVAPSITPSAYASGPWSGDISYTLKADECGTATYHVTATDDGVMSSGPSPVDTATSIIHTITIGVNCANTPPSFVDAGNPAAVLQSGTDTSVNIPWASSISVGTQPGEADQQLVFTLALTSGTLDIFTEAPTLSPNVLSPGPWSGTLAYTLKANTCGKAAFKVVLTDDGVMTPPPNDVAMSSTEHGLVIYVRCPNTVPTFLDLGAPAPINQAGVTQSITINNWAYDILPGTNPEEGNQPIRFVVGPVSVPAGLFTAAGFPTIQQTAFTTGPYTPTPWGRLTYTIAAGACGTATLGAYVEDNGAMNPAPNEPPLASIVHSLVITVDCINGAPSFSVPTTTVTVLEDAAPYDAPFVTNIVAGPAANPWEATQQLKFSVNVLTNPSVFASMPVVTKSDYAAGPFTAADGWGRLQFTLAKDRCTTHTGGTAVTFRVTATDNGPTGAPHVNSYTLPSGAGVYTLNVQCVNDPPVFETQNVVVDMNSGATSMQWTLPLPGPVTALDEQWGMASQQRLRFTTSLTSTTNGLTFSGLPSVTQTPCATFCNGPYTAANNWGVLTFTPTNNQYGSALVNTCLQDSGGTTPTLDTTCKDWTIYVRPPGAQDGGGYGAPQDHDQDGVATGADNCAGTANPGQTDSGSSGEGDACTTKPLPEPEPEPEAGPAPAPAPPLDTDKDSIADSADNCPTVANREQSDFDRDGLGDVCDADIDGDGMTNGNEDGYQDPCPDAPGETGACAQTIEPEVLEDHSVPPAEVQTAGGGQNALNVVGWVIAILGGLLVSAIVVFFVVRRRRDDETSRQQQEI